MNEMILTLFVMLLFLTGVTTDTAPRDESRRISL
jgi:hypothetical protein